MWREKEREGEGGGKEGERGRKERGGGGERDRGWSKRRRESCCVGADLQKPLVWIRKVFIDC